MVGQTTLNIMKIQFANGNTYEVADVDEAIAKCLADGNDPFNPVVVKSSPATAKQDKTESKDADRE
jgi:uncharacterized protein (UPF0179 family)